MDEAEKIIEKKIGYCLLTMVIIMAVLFLSVFASCKSNELPENIYPRCSCFNCTDHKSGIIPILTMEELQYNVNNYITDLPEELPESGDLIALKGTDTTLFVQHFHPRYGRKYYKGWYVYLLK